MSDKISPKGNTVTTSVSTSANGLASDYAFEKLKSLLIDDPTGKKDSKKYEIVAKGKQIIVPEKVPLKKVIETLQRKAELDELEVQVYEEIEAFPLDGAHAFSKVLADTYGWADAVPTEKQGFFGPVIIPPTTVSLEIGFNKSIPIFWGSFKIPDAEGTLESTIANSQKSRRPIFVIRGKVKQKDRERVKDLAQDVRDYLKKNSIYKGKAIRLNTNEEGEFNYDLAPSFMDTSQVKPKELVFSDTVMEQVQTNIFTPIEKTAECREYGIPLKRGILLESTYGTGKTMTANVTAHKAEQNGWTFIYIDRVTALSNAILFARDYAPAILFAEDIDRVMSGERDIDTDDILNIIDGVDSKHSEIITILTTNDVNAIEKAMLRPGRLDAVISITPPDAKAAEKLIRMYGRGLIDSKENITESGKELSGQIPAVIREVVERSKLYAIGRTKPGEKLQLTGKDLLASARGMKNHLTLMNPPKSEEFTVEHKLGASLKEVVSDAFNGSKESIKYIHSKVDEIQEHLS